MVISMRNPRPDSSHPDDDALDALPVEEEPVWAEPADDVVEAALVEDESEKPPSARRVPLTPWQAFCAAFEAVVWLLEWPFGGVSLIGGLAGLGAVPLLAFLSLGYLLEAGGRIARTDAERQRYLHSRKR